MSGFSGVRVYGIARSLFYLSTLPAEVLFSDHFPPQRHSVPKEIHMVWLQLARYGLRVARHRWIGRNAQAQSLPRYSVGPGACLYRPLTSGFRGSVLGSPGRSPLTLAHYFSLAELEHNLYIKNSYLHFIWLHRTLARTIYGFYAWILHGLEASIFKRIG